MQRFKLGAVGALCGLAILLPVNSLGAKTPSTTCAGLTDCTTEVAALATSANPLGLSAFNLDENTTGTAASFSVMETIHDSSGATASITGVFTTELRDDNPQQALAAFVAAGPSGLPLTYSANFTIATTPEPVSVTLVGIGLLGLGLFRLRRR